MNFQSDTGIDWLRPNGYTWNVLSGCKHLCEWRMADGKVIPCYAKTIAEGLAKRAYPYGFEHIYWHPERLKEPLEEKTPAKIFLDSQGDFAANGVERWQQNTILDTAKHASWHTFISLTKNPKGYLGLDFPKNIWVGFSTPPDFFFGHELTMRQKVRKLEVDLETMKQIKASVKFFSGEPLSWDIAPHMKDCGLHWGIIGAASDGPKKHQPNPAHVSKLIDTLQDQRIKIYMKENLRWTPHLKEFPC